MMYQCKGARQNTHGGERVKSDGFETDEVVTTRNGRRYSGGPGRVLSDHDAISPDTIVYRAVDETGLIDLELYHGRGEDQRGLEADQVQGNIPIGEC